MAAWLRDHPGDFISKLDIFLRSPTCLYTRIQVPQKTNGAQLRKG